MVFDRQQHRERAGGEGRLGDRLYHGAEADLRGERVTVVDDRCAVIAVPAVQLNAAAAGEQNLRS